MARALLARRAAGVREPARRQRRALHGLSAQEELLQRDGRRAAAGASASTSSQDYIDAQNGGPGKGWFRIVTTPVRGAPRDQRGQARGRPRDRGLQALRLRRLQRAAPSARPSRSTAASTRSTTMGVRDMELVNKFDNALAGVAGDYGDDRRRRQRRQHDRDRQVLADAALRRPQPRPRPRAAHGARRRPRRAGRQRPARASARPARRRSTRRAPHCNTRGLTDARRAPRAADDREAR